MMESRFDGGDMNTTHAGDAVVIVEYDPQWPALFEQERVRIQPAIAVFAVSIDHIGSTAVPGLCAKPIVDLLVTVEQLGPPDRYDRTLAAHGYVLRRDPANTERYAFGKRDAQGRRPVPGYNLHVVQHDGREHRRHIAFRDYLRMHPEAIGEYGDLKRRLAAAYGSDRDAYTNAKTAFVRSIEAKCL